MELAFELHHRAADGRLGQAQRLAGLAEAAALGDAEEYLELAEADVHGGKRNGDI
ncbi:hypothetical protein GCM10027195_17460 [Comamonas sediminis]